LVTVPPPGERRVDDATIGAHAAPVSLQAPPMNRLLAFYADAGTDHRGRSRHDILREDDAWLEATHDYVQWLFPLSEPSGVLASAPLVDAEVAAAFASDATLRDALQASYHRMLAFYGLAETGDSVGKGPNWLQRKRNWFTHPTHNNLRITRILKSLCALGLPAHAARFATGLDALRATESDCGVGATAFAYWHAAVGR
jgi:hypothetical protein